MASRKPKTNTETLTSGMNTPPLTDQSTQKGRTSRRSSSRAKHRKTAGAGGGLPGIVGTAGQNVPAKVRNFGDALVAIAWGNWSISDVDNYISRMESSLQLAKSYRASLQQQTHQATHAAGAGFSD